MSLWLIHQLPTHLVCRKLGSLASLSLLVEMVVMIVGGYTRYFQGPRIWNKISWLPFLRYIFGQTIAQINLLYGTGWENLCL